MGLIGALIVAPLWGMVSAQWFMRAGLAFVVLPIHGWGVVIGRISRIQCVLGMAAALFFVALYSVALLMGYWLLTNVFSFGQTLLENVVYWGFAIFSALFMMPRVAPTVMHVWCIEVGRLSHSSP